MPTIANMPGADVPVKIKDDAEGIDVEYNVNMIVLLAETLNAEMKVKTGHFHPTVNKLKPTVKALDAKYHLYYYFDGPVKTWVDCAAALRHLYNLCDQHIKSNR